MALLENNTVTLFERVFGGNDYNYERTAVAIDAAIAQYGESEPVAFPSTAYNLPCYYSVTGKKVNNLGELKAALENDIKPMMTRNKRLQDVFDSGIASALCAEFLEVLKYLHGAEPYAEPEMGFLTDSFVRNLGLPLVTGDIPGVAVVLGKADNAEDVVQETFIQYHTTLKQYESEEHIRAWLLRVAINKAKNVNLTFWRRNKQPLEDYIEDLTFETKEASNLFEAVLALPEKYRVVIHLFYYEDYSVKEIAGVLKTSESNVKVRLSRGRGMLKEALKEEWEDDK